MSLPEFLKTIAGIVQLEDSGITALYQTLGVQTHLSLANVKLYVSELRGIKYLIDHVAQNPNVEIRVINTTADEFVSELRGIKYLIDHVAQNPNVEIRVINTTADEFVNWLQQDAPITGQRKKAKKGA